MGETIYVLSESFGKDSMAMLHEVVTRGLPLNYVIHCDIMFDNNTSGEHPLMAEWIPYAEKRIKDELDKQSKNITKSIQEGKKTKTLITETNEGAVDDSYGLSEIEQVYAQKLGMTNQEYAKWKK